MRFVPLFVLLAIALPASAQDQNADKPAKVEKKEKRVCKSTVRTGSRLSRETRCVTASEAKKEHDALEQDIGKGLYSGSQINSAPNGGNN
jgi:hypothetical protein